MTTPPAPAETIQIGATTLHDVYTKAGVDELLAGQAGEAADIAALKADVAAAKAQLAGLLGTIATLAQGQNDLSTRIDANTAAIAKKVDGLNGATGLWLGAPGTVPDPRDPHVFYAGV